ncbi:MAG: FHA domain-containing protein [Hyphomicrobiaceae bacterium]
MMRLRRHGVVLGTIALWLSGLPPGVGHAQDLRLLAQCTPPELAPSAPSTSAGSDDPAAATPAPPVTNLTCNLWATDAVQFKEVRANVKGRTDRLQVRFEPRNQSLAAMFIIQMMEPSRRALTSSMVDTVLKITEMRTDKQRFAAYTIANDLNLVADFDASKAEFEKKVKGIRGALLPTQLYKDSLEAIGKLAKARADRKALIILGDGNSDDTSYDHDQVVKAAKEAGVIIHALGFAAEAANLPTFQNIRRLAEETGGFRREVRVGGTQKYTVGNQFAAEALENGGTARITLKEPPGPTTLRITADFAGGKSEALEHALTVPTPPPPPEPAHVADPPPPSEEPQPAAWHEKLVAWAGENPAVAAISGVAVGLGTIGLALFAFSSHAARKARLAEEGGAEAEGGMIYGWLDMLDGNASQYPLQTTNVRIGRHRDNDICLLNDSISRRHALLHYNADTRRFVITDLGGGNGVIVNKVRQQSHDLNDGDLVELGEVRLRFRANTEVLT